MSKRSRTSRRILMAAATTPVLTLALAACGSGTGSGHSSAMPGMDHSSTPSPSASADAMASMPGIKTASEQGLANFNIAAWNALMVPRGVPPEIQAKLSSEMRKILDLPETQQALADLGFERAPVRTNAELNAWLREERSSYLKTIRTAHMKPD